MHCLHEQQPAISLPATTLTGRRLGLHVQLAAIRLRGHQGVLLSRLTYVTRHQEVVRTATQQYPLHSTSTGASAVSPTRHSAAQALQESGGAIALAAGGTFCLALTAMGKVIVWGKIGGPAGQPGARPAVAEIMGLPPITSIAAGQSHALMTDGEHVWALGRQACCSFM